VKILGISGGSENGTNDAMVREALMGAKEMGAEVEFIHLLDLNLKPCNGCLSCVVGKKGIINGGSGACILKDDFAWLEDKFYDADGVIFCMPVFEKGLPGFFKSLQDRLGGPSHDIGMLTVAKSIHEKKGMTSGGPDPRAFKKRFATYIGIGGSDWVCRMSADFNLFGMSPMLQVVDDLVFDWGKSIVMQDDRVARIREAGRSIAKAVMDPDNAKYLGDLGICTNCHSRLMYLSDDAKRVECSVCGIIGELVVENGKIKFEFAPDQYERAHNTLPGKIKHVEDIGKHEGEFAAAKQTEKFKKRIEVYQEFIQPSVPEKVKKAG
jgi:multimeric flavodoxin WrbA